MIQLQPPQSKGARPQTRGTQAAQPPSQPVSIPESVQAAANEKIYGVFSSQEIRKVGTGTTTRKVVSKIYWFVEENADSTITVQSINSNYVPTGVKKIIDREELLQKYFPEPEFYTATVYPKMRQLDEKLDNADTARKRGENFTAEYEYGNALSVDVTNIRANFGIGLTYLERGDSEKANNIFERLINLEGAYEPKHKHLFNEFGINLRKSKLYDQSVVYYKKALEMNTKDENLHLNMARVYLEIKDITNCYKHVMAAYELAPNNELTMKFIEWLKVKNLLTPDQLVALRNAKIA